MIGSVFLGRYKILEELGRGGMGVVYKAQDTKLGRNVALKFLPPDLTRDPVAKERFVNEARAASALDHPNICIVHEIEEADDGRIFISMGWYEGETLKERIERGLPDIGEAMDIAIQVSEGLEDAHEKGIVHRDIKPSNIMVTVKGQAKIMDFGLAKLAGQTRITRTGTTMGTVAYMSPEQARGEDIDHRTDIWSWGVVLYEMLTGERPFKGEYDQAVVYSILNEEHRPVSEIKRGIPTEVEAIVDRCLKKDPSERYQSSGELATDLRGVIGDTSGIGYALTRGSSPSLRRLSRMSLIRVGIPLVVTVAAVVILSVIPAGRDSIKRLVLGDEQPAGNVKVAVLPCSVRGGNASDTAFCDGMAKVLTDKLTLLERYNEGFRVMPFHDVLGLEEKTPLEARRILAVNVVLTGTMERSADAMRMRPVRIDFDVEAGTGGETDAFMERRGAMVSDPLANLSTWQDSIVMDLAGLLGCDIPPEARELVLAHGTSVPEAYMFYLEGTGFLSPCSGKTDTGKAIDAFSRAIDNDSSYVLAYLGLGKARYLSGNYDDDPSIYESALEAFDKALEKDERCADAHVAAGYAYLWAERPDEAARRFRQAMELDSVSFYAYLGLGNALCDAEEFDRAETALLRAAELRPHVPETYELLTYLYLAYEGEYLKAVETASKSIELKPNTSRGYCELGAAYYSLGRMNEARDAFEKSLDIDSTYYACANLGTIYFGQRRYADAARMYEAALGLGPGNYRIVGFLAEAYYWSPGRRDIAIETFKQAIELLDRGGVLDETDPMQVSDLASYYARIGESAEGESLLVKAELLEPEETMILFRIADTYEQLGKRDLAIEWLGRALEKGAPLETMADFPGLRGLKSDARYKQMLESRSLDS